ncbi:phage tail length tape measure family protein, partial [Neisseria meningitidis]|uniref:phage tail length tape measure family protein n=1 Tax=Neisseria meningitidis TaxID=487 RepID=UPI001EE04105
MASLENAIRRDIAVKIAGGKANREYYEELARQRGIDIARLNPLLSQLDRHNTQTNRATQSVKQFNNALRQTPAQITDIVTQLAGGQSPFLIMIQQGGQ